MIPPSFGGRGYRLRDDVPRSRTGRPRAEVDARSLEIRESFGRRPPDRRALGYSRTDHPWSLATLLIPVGVLALRKGAAPPSSSLNATPAPPAAEPRSRGLRAPPPQHHRSGLQRGGRGSTRPSASLRGKSTTRVRDHRGRRRLHRRHGRDRRGARPAERPRRSGRRTRGKPARAQQRRPRAARDYRRHDRRRHRLRARDLHQLVQPFARPRVGAVSGNAKVGNRQGLLGRWQHIEYVMGFNLDRRMYDLLRCMPTVPGRDRRVPPRRADRGRRRQRRHPRRGHRHHDGHLPRRAGGSSTTSEPAPGPRHPRRSAAVAPALPLVLRHHAGDVEAPRRDLRAAPRAGSAASACPTWSLFQVLLPLLAPLIDVFALYGVVFLDPLPTSPVWLGFRCCSS